MKGSTLVIALCILVVSAAAMLGLAVAAGLHHRSGIALLVLCLGVPVVLALQGAQFLEPRVRRLRLKRDGAGLPRARARYRP